MITISISILIDLKKDSADFYLILFVLFNYFNTFWVKIFHRCLFFCDTIKQFSVNQKRMGANKMGFMRTNCLWTVSFC
jgi:hypothetical protein